MTETYDRIQGFTQDIQKQILRRSEGDITRVPKLVEQAMTGAFNTQFCRGLKGKLMCEYIPEDFADTVIEMVEQHKKGKGSQRIH